MELTILYAFEVVAAIASFALNIIRRERNYTKSKPAPLTGRRPTILVSMKPIILALQVYDVLKKKS